MTLSELANFICGKVNQTETEDVAACKGFLTRRHDLIWQDALWKDSLVEYRQTLSADIADYTVASNWLPAKGVLLLPPIIQRVLAARTTLRALNVRRPEFFYRIDYDAFAKTGQAAQFILLPPCVWEWETAQTVLVQRSNTDAALSLTADLLDSDGVGVTRSATVLTNDYTSLGSSERIDQVTKLAGSGAVSVGAPGVCTLVYPEYVGYLPLDWFMGATSFDEVRSEDLVATLATGDVANVTPNAYVAVISANTGGVPLDNQPVPGGANFGGRILLLEDYTFAINRDTPSGGATLAAADTNAKRRQRIRLVEIPDTQTTIRVLGKRSAPTFSADNDEPAIAGMENCLIAFAQADMYERDETDPTAKLTEAIALLDQLKKIETVQQAHNSAIMPAAGYGEDCLGSYCGWADSANPLGW